MHGVGSNEQDLFSLAPQIPERFHVLSLRAPFRMGPGAHAWFDFSIEPGGERTINEEQEAQSRALVAQAVESATEQLGIPPERVVVGGFSQGGIMALSLLLTRPALMQAALVWHSRLLQQVVPLTAPADALRGKQLWLSHGTHDNVIPLAHAQASARSSRCNAVRRRSSSPARGSSSPKARAARACRASAKTACGSCHVSPFARL